MTALEAYRIVVEENDNTSLNLVECVDLGDSFGFAFVDWDEEKLGPLDYKKVPELFIVSGWTAVNKETGEVFQVNGRQFYKESPDMKGKVTPIIINTGRE